MKPTSIIIKELRQKLNMTQEELADKLGVKKSAIAKYEAGRVENLKRDTIAKLSDIFGVRPTYILGYCDELRENENEIIFNDYFPLKYFKNLSAGSTLELIENDYNAIVYVPIQFQKSIKHLVAMDVNGDSMDKIIPNGATVVIYTNIDFINLKNNDIVAVKINGEATVKTFIKLKDKFILAPNSNNKEHQFIIPNEEDEIKLIGKVIWYSLPFDFLMHH